jgi:hypothetical protein
VLVCLGINLEAGGVVLINSVLVERPGIKVLLLSGKRRPVHITTAALTNYSCSMTDNAIGGEIHKLAKNLVHCTSLETLSLTRTCAFMFFLDFYLIVIVFMAGTGLDDTGAVELIPMLGKCPNLTTLDLNGNRGSMALITAAR